ncbi:MAG: hypothetical protein ABJA80_05390 [bacterium]
MHRAQQRNAPATSAPPSGNEIQNQIRQTILEANQAAREASQAAREAGQAARSAGRNGDAVIATVPPVPPVPPFGAFTIQNDGFGRHDVPPGVKDISIAFFLMCAVIAIGWPLARAFGRRLERRGDVAAVPAGLSDQLQRIELAVDSMSIEIERISESQRFMARLQNAQTPEKLATPADSERG